jgi:hypothetical protein
MWQTFLLQTAVLVLSVHRQSRVRHWQHDPHLQLWLNIPVLLLLCGYVCD